MNGRIAGTPRWLWPALAVAAACIPFLGGLSRQNIFFARDLTMFFWPRHLWIRQAILSGTAPLWDPYAAAGQPVYPDALNQLFLPPVLALRALLPAVPGFNAIVAAPFPLAALGSWLFLRRHFAPASATVGAVVFVASGPVLSTSNFPNLSWSVAWIPWILWAIDRDRLAPGIGRFSAIAAFGALQVLSGEPVTMTGSFAMALGYALVCGGDDVPGRARLRAVARVAGALLVAAVLAIVQLLPMAVAARVSPRAVLANDNFWSLHPLSIVEMALPHLFGNTINAYDRALPWLHPFNSGRDPFFYSMYVGAAVLLVSFLGTLVGRPRWRFFWTATVVAAIVAALGRYTPVYPIVQALVPPVRSFRFPVKFLVFAAFGIAMLAASAADARGRPEGERAVAAPGAIRATVVAGLAAATALAGLIGLVTIAPFTGARLFYELAAAVGVADPVEGAKFLFENVPPIAGRVVVLVLAATVLVPLAWSGKRSAGLARGLLLAVAAVDLLVANAGVCPVFPAWRLGPPAWVSATRNHPADRVYFGGNFRGFLVPGDPDLPLGGFRPVEGLSGFQARMVFMSQLAMAPAAWQVRELISYDLPQLWPVQVAIAEELFQRAGRSERLRFLARGDVRYCVLGAPPRPDARPIAPVGEGFSTMAVYECVPDAERVYVVPKATIVPDVNGQIVRLFDSSFDAGSTVMLGGPPPQWAGSPGPPSPPFARVIADADQRVAIDAGAGPQGGYLVLLDSFADGWRVEVDGRPAPLLRANGMYRAVRLTPGRHTIVFGFHPTVLYVSLGISVGAALALAAFVVTSGAARRKRRANA